MKLPKMTAEQFIKNGRVQYNKGTSSIAAGSTGLNPAGFDLSAVLNCGVSVLPCIACGLNPACWLTCAGPGVFNCVKEFLS